MIPKNLKSRDMVGMEVRTVRTIKNRAGIVVPKGKIVKITRYGRAFTIETKECPHCGLSAYISGVTRDMVELIPEDWDMIWSDIYDFQKILPDILPDTEEDLEKMGLHPTIGKNGERLLINDELSRRLFVFRCSN